MATDQSTPENSPFRRWFHDCLGTLPGRTVEWPVLLRHILAEEFQELRNSDQYYSGDVFRNRDKEVAKHRGRDSQDEEILVYRLYAAVHDENHGLLKIGDESVWLFSCEVPNQGKKLSNRTKKRRADLLGLREDGSLIVFECKGPKNPNDSPIYGLLEGLDYLGCLLTSQNLPSLSEGLQEWLGEHEPQDGQFSSVFPEDWPLEIVPEARHGVVVLAPKSYYDSHIADSSGRPKDWWLLSERFAPSACGESDVFLDFAVVDYEQGSAKWLEMPNPKPGTEQVEPKPVEPGDVELTLPHNLIWDNGTEEIRVTKVRQGRRNVRVELPDKSRRLVPRGQLRQRPQPKASSCQ